MNVCISQKKIYDFKNGSGPVPAHQHVNGGGWVADTASADATVYIGPLAMVHGFASIRDYAYIDGQADIAGYAIVKDQACVRGNAVIRGSCEISEKAEIAGDVFLSGDVKINGRTVMNGKECHFEMEHCLNCSALLDDNYTASHVNHCADCMVKYNHQKSKKSPGRFSFISWMRTK